MAATTITAVAAVAGVAGPTVYQAFGTKAVEAERLAAATAFARRLHELGGVRVDESRARDTLFPLTAIDVPHRLVAQRGLTEQALAAWLADTMTTQLPRSPATRAP